MRKKAYQWELFRLKASPAVFVGLVYAPDEKTAVKAAIKEFSIREDHKSLLVRRAR
jgi:1,2-phenylacetyl-CoA epoxidase PaaB subunit